MAMDSLWIVVASILASFDITKTVGEGGNIIEPTYEYFSGLAWYVYIYYQCLSPNSFKNKHAPSFQVFYPLKI
jgi:hypothetical protein